MLQVAQYVSQVQTWVLLLAANCFHGSLTSNFLHYADETRAKLLGAGKTLLRFSLSKGPALALLPVAAWTAVRSLTAVIVSEWLLNSMGLLHPATP